MTLGPDWAFETGNLGRLTRRVPASQIVSAVPPSRRKPKPHELSKNPKPPQKPRGSSAARFLRLAQEWKRQLDAGEIASQAAIARREGITRARVCQIMSLLRLAPEIQQRVLAGKNGQGGQVISERELRPLTTMATHEEQLTAALGKMAVVGVGKESAGAAGGTAAADYNIRPQSPTDS